MSALPSNRGSVKERRQASRHDVGARILQQLKARGMRQRELAEQTGLPNSTVSNIINGKRGASTDQLSAIAGALGCEVSTLVLVPERSEAAATEASARARVVVAVDDYFARREPGAPPEERELIAAWLTARAPAMIDDALIEDLLRGWRANLERTAQRPPPVG
jgi:transcriptional regulator with XRE-family HTH domain